MTTQIDLDTMMRQAQQRKRTIQEQQQRYEATKAETERAETITAFRQLFDSEVSADIQTALGIDFSHETLYQCHPGYAQFEDVTGMWQIGRSKHNREYPWRIQRFKSHNDPCFVRDKMLCAWLLAELADARDAQAAAEAKRQEAEREAERRRIEWVAEQAERELRETQKQAERQADHEEIAARVAQEIAEATAALWHWPEGKTFTLYHWTWFLGVDGDGDGVFDDGWSEADQLDAAGYVYFHDVMPRDVRLIPESHKPVVERVVFASIDDLKRHKLAWLKRLRIDGAASYEGCWQYVEDYYSEEIEIGYEPLPWLQKLLEA